MMKLCRMRWERQVAGIGERRNAHRSLIEKPEEIRSLRRPRHKCRENIKMGWGCMEWIELAQNRDHRLALVNTVKNLWVS
jgi:hypothetical protein